ncbi:sugar ABC transporter substrate-binding protein [Bordetella hinzii]|jgi:ABC-type sugar transport system substrate-binding protein|uniref:Sugar ABC transporter substrate-binding protein n=2 Tax=Bordetella hinzii TaxID=103855 RepID=A0AAN1RV34_9BORD|nr:sugar ABC transporter substrate-binding protein [Bordetella hinzii]AKQ53479.1 D-allose-binding periplasmic protein precursor [Bordetella hinzii]AKQ58040.1 D-allose-binding periplasmic protein precursor [Bordetella hinzii]AZW16606.1 sugar ABC transporter substrate-binding protein [Bordetella hinzii]KXA73709.1 ABC transporter substrate-binding protein [Bordetella hinzii LMG 13501]MBZ0074102.1 sugar ABC transporter substrate-binding protein [Bordetella hinzii]
MGVIKRVSAGLAVSAILLGSGAAAQAQEVMNDPFRAPALEALKDKKIAYLPISIGFDLAQAWGGVVKQQAQVYGMKFTSQDPNWNTGAMVQGFTALLAERPDVILTQNPDMQSLARLMKQANQQGIVVVQMNMAGAVQTDAVVAPDFIGMGEAIANKVVEKCGAGTNTSHKVSIVQGVLTGGVSFYQVQGFNKVFAKHPDIKIVSSQAADWDASKARSITETVLQQNPDLCAVIDVWDGQGVGTGAAIKQAGLADKVFFITSGGGAQSMCDKLKDGTFSAVYNYDAVGMGRDAWTAIMVALQNKKGGGAIKTQMYSPYRYMTKADVKDGTCFNPEEYAKILR